MSDVQVKIDQVMLFSLLETARRAGTIDRWADIACQYIAKLTEEHAALREAAGKAANDCDDIATDYDLLSRDEAISQLRAVSAALRAILQERKP